MNGGYKKAMDGIRFSEAAKERMARNLVAAQGASHAPAASATRQARERTPVRARAGGKRRWQAVAAAAAAVGVLAVLGGAAYASGALMTMAEAVDAAFTGAPTPTEIVDKVGRPVGAGASSNGVTVTAEAIFGDREKLRHRVQHRQGRRDRVRSSPENGFGHAAAAVPGREPDRKRLRHAQQQAARRTSTTPTPPTTPSSTSRGRA